MLISPSYFYRLDDEIYEHTLETFPELKEEDYAKIVKLDEEWMKTKDGKERWRKFIERYVSTYVTLKNNH